MMGPSEKIAAAIWNCRSAARGQQWDRLERIVARRIFDQAEGILVALENGVPPEHMEAAIDALCAALPSSAAGQEEQGRG